MPVSSTDVLAPECINAGGTILGAASGLIAKGLALAVTGGTYE